MRKAKIVCTIGPASDHLESLDRLIEQGMNAAPISGLARAALRWS